jgi:hypothetical protein
MSNVTNGSNATSTPKAYVIFIKESMHDEVEMARYKAAIGTASIRRCCVPRDDRRRNCSG